MYTYFFKKESKSWKPIKKFFKSLNNRTQENNIDPKRKAQYFHGALYVGPTLLMGNKF